MANQLAAINLLPPAAALPPELAPEAADSYLTDESRLRGRAERLFFPSSEAISILWEYPQVGQETSNKCPSSFSPISCLRHGKKNFSSSAGIK